MAASSVSVVGSSLLLKFWKRPKWMRVEALDENHGAIKGNIGAEGMQVADLEVQAEEIKGKSVRATIRRVVSGLLGRKEGRERGTYIPLREVGEDDA